MWETAGLPAVFAEWPSDDADAPTVLVYGHHDVQPVTPLELWEHPPFEPTVDGDRLHARGAADDKGQVCFHTLGVRAHLAATGRTSPAVNLKLLVEGEEESGSPNFAALLEEKADRLAADVVVVSDTGMWSRETPTVCTGMRGMTDGQLDLRGPTGDVHSGSFGGAVRNPLTELARVLAALHDDDGHVTIDGFYDGVVELTDDERALIAKLPFDEQAWLANAAQRHDVRREGVQHPGAGLGPARRPRSTASGAATPAPGTRRSSPSEGHAKLSFRLVAGQEPGDIQREVRDLAGHRRAATASSGR